MSTYADQGPIDATTIKPAIRLWSVTTLIKLGLGTGDALVNWAVNTTAEAAYDRHKILSQFVQDKDRQGAVEWLRNQRWQKSGQAAARGIDLHRAAERLALGQPPEIEEHNLPYLEQYRRFLDHFSPEFLMAEAPVYNIKLGYAGTLDAVLKLDGQPLVADVKTTPWGPDELNPDTGKPRSRPPYPEVALQLVGYRKAELVGVLSEQRYDGGKRYYMFNPDGNHEPMPQTAGAVCIVVSPHDYTVTPMRTDEVVWRYFKHVRECARWTVEGSKLVIGPQLAPVRREQ